MPRIKKMRYSLKERERHDATYKRLWKIITTKEPDSDEFRRALEDALAEGLTIDNLDKNGCTLLHHAIDYIPSVIAGLPQILIEAWADVNIRSADYCAWTPLGDACWRYMYNGLPEYLALINILLEAGAHPELDEKWKEEQDWHNPEQQARRDWLEAYIAACNDRRAAQDRGEAAAPAFDYAL